MRERRKEGGRKEREGRREKRERRKEGSVRENGEKYRKEGGTQNKRVENRHGLPFDAGFCILVWLVRLNFRDRLYKTLLGEKRENVEM